MTSAPPDPRPSITIAVSDLPTMALKLIVSDNMPTIDYALNMLAQATRVLEAERRKQEVLDMVREQQKNERVAQLIVRPQ